MRAGVSSSPLSQMQMQAYFSPIFLTFFHHASLYRQLYLTPLECYPILAGCKFVALILNRASEKCCVFGKSNAVKTKIVLRHCLTQSPCKTMHTLLYMAMKCH